MYIALYSPNHGLCGFRCTIGDCTRVVRTLRGVKAHCWRCHGVKQQISLPMEVKRGENNEASAKYDEQSIRSVYDAASGEQLFKDSNSSTYRDPSA